ncbi:MAG TPA: glycosyltransferase family 4 protein [archaeon]|nr:glycosyltransferase family 4 protein [archaeon]
MKILMIGWGFPPRIDGGLDTHVFEISRELARRNDVLLALPAFNSPRKAPEGVKIIPIRCPRFSRMRSLVNSVKEYNRNIIRKCGNLDFDVIHSHDWFGVEACSELRERTGKPWVFTLHSLEYMRSCQNGKSAMERLERRGAEECDRVITVSKGMKKSIVRDYGISPGKIDVVYNSARMGRVNTGNIRRRFGLGKGPVILFLGRLSSQKGVEYVIHSAKMVSEKIPEARFLVAGEGNLKGSLEIFSSHLGLDGKVIFAGFVPQKDLASYYSAADVFVLPSLHEPFGITVLESLLSGTPVVVSENAGVLENVPEMKCIMKVRPSDSEELAGEITHFLERPFRVSGREIAALQKAYSWEKSARQIESIYQKLM